MAGVFSRDIWRLLFSKYLSFYDAVVFERVSRRMKEFMTDDQRFAGRRTDVITFKTSVLENDLTLAGTVTADLKVSISILFKFYSSFIEIIKTIIKYFLPCHFFKFST